MLATEMGPTLHGAVDAAPMCQGRTGELCARLEAETQALFEAHLRRG